MNLWFLIYTERSEIGGISVKQYIFNRDTEVKWV